MRYLDFIIIFFFMNVIQTIPFSTQCWEKLNGKENMFKDGLCQSVNRIENGWRTTETNDWTYYPQQYVNVSMTLSRISIASVGGCCAPNRYKKSGFIYKDDGSSYETTGKKITFISDQPIVQTIKVEGWYMKKFVDDEAMNLTIIPSIQHADKKSILFELAAFDRAMMISYGFYDYKKSLIGNLSSEILRNKYIVPDITLPKFTRFIVISIYSSRADPICFSYIYAGLYVDKSSTSLFKLCNKATAWLQYISLINFVLTPTLYFINSFITDFSFPPPVRFLSRTPSHKTLLSIFIMLGSFILNHAWNILNSQSSIFHDWLPRAARIIELFLSFFLYAVYFYPVFLSYHASYTSRLASLIGLFVTSVLFFLRVGLDLPTFVITYARSPMFLTINILAAIPTLVAYGTVLKHFLIRIFSFEECWVCNAEFMQVDDIEEQYVKYKLLKGGHNKVVIKKSIFFQICNVLLISNWKIESVKRSLRDPEFYGHCIRSLFGTQKYVRIPFSIKASLTLLTYCLSQLIPLLMIELIGVGGIVPRYICSWSPYLSKFQNRSNPMEFALTTFMFMQIATYVGTLCAGSFCIIYSFGILRRFTKDILHLRRGNYFLFKGKRNNGIDLDDAIRFLGVFIGFGFTGTLYFMLEISFIGTLITSLIQLDRIRDLVFRHVGYGMFFVSFFIAFIVQLIQKRLTNLIFIENRSRFTIQYRSPFLHYWYFMMLTSMTRALTSYIIRTLKLIFRYPLFSLRVDRNAETWSVRRGDGGFTAYCGMLLAEHEYNNPVVLVFIESLLLTVTQNLDKNNPKLCKMHQHRALEYSTVQSTSKSSNLEIHDGNELEEIVVSDKDREKSCLSLLNGFQKISHTRARTKWFLAYTLINNPGLQRYRKHQLNKLYNEKN